MQRALVRAIDQLIALVDEGEYRTVKRTALLHTHQITLLELEREHLVVRTIAEVHRTAAGDFALQTRLAGSVKAAGALGCGATGEGDRHTQRCSAANQRKGKGLGKRHGNSFWTDRHPETAELDRPAP